MNYRQLFNPNYNYIGIIIIIILSFLIIILNKNNLAFLKIIGITLVTSGIIAIVILSTANILANIIVSTEYNFLIKIVTKNLNKVYILSTIITISLGIALLMISKLKLTKFKI